jgi:hypothetical protein
MLFDEQYQLRSSAVLRRLVQTGHKLRISGNDFDESEINCQIMTTV